MVYFLDEQKGCIKGIINNNGAYQIWLRCIFYNETGYNVMISNGGCVVEENKIQKKRVFWCIFLYTFNVIILNGDLL